ncbi:hypothetical protein Glove_301g57 [Diversispora epigaea]|uniref:Uncharacterized protein n=1 Tax=Diversispora epigaea TaxID=1348612 RepID=A0A397HX83_9GLOM|nr:hypothetical protein Glove_301g57 [Diversispora epigaea]
MRMVGYLKSKLQKFNDTSKWSKIFVLTSIIQAIITVILETRLLVRNDYLRQDLSTKSSNITGIANLTLTTTTTTTTYHFPEMEFAYCEPTDVDRLIERIKRIESENVIFMLFQIFQIWLNLDAIYRENTIQLITITIINFLCSAFSIIQLIEILVWRRRLMNACSLTTLHLVGYDIPLIIVYMLFATLMGFLCYHLYQEFGWNIYKTIGGNILMQRVYRTYLIFILFLKVDIFFLLIFAIETWVAYLLQQSDSNQDTFVPHAIASYNKVITVLIVFSEVIGIVSARKEWKIGMIVFFVSWIGVTIDFIAILYSTAKSVSADSWYFLIIFLSVGVVLSVFTLIWGVFVFFNFGKGVKDILLGKAGDTPNQNNPSGFVIDDDDE